jgi:DNA-directed RNA polymerase subunit RPC12/RpoP
LGAINEKDMRYEYSCSQCGGTVSKPSVSSDKEGKSLHGLHGWKCPKDGPVKVKRVMKSKSE